MMEQFSSDDTEASDGRLEELLQQSSSASVVKVEEDPPVVIKLEQEETKEASTGTEDLQSSTGVQTEAQEDEPVTPTSPAANPPERSPSKSRSSPRRRRRSTSSSGEKKRLRRVGLKCLDKAL